MTKALNDESLIACHASATRKLKVDKALRDKVGQIAVLGAVPYLFIGIEFGGVRGQPFDLDSSPESPLQSIGGAAMDRVSIHDTCSDP
jgi:hypothetical protein